MSQKKFIWWKGSCPGYCWGYRKLQAGAWKLAICIHWEKFQHGHRFWEPESHRRRENLDTKEKLLDLLNQRDCLSSVMRLLARSYSRVPILTDPFIRPLPRQQWPITSAHHHVADKPLTSAVSILYLPSGHQMVTWERRQAQTMGNRALEQGWSF